MNKKYYVTTTLPYANAAPHIGFAAEIVRADMLARYWRSRGGEVFFNTGTDEHGLKIFRKSAEAGVDPQAYTDEYAAKFDALKRALDLSYDAFIRTTDPKHIAAAQEFWRRCAAAGDIYKKQYRIRYCVGCEAEKTDSDLAKGKCPEHPNLELETIDEENYFFRFSKYGERLLAFYREHPDFVVPSHRQNEIVRFVERGLQDFSISRLKAKMPWGVPVPDDPDQVMYVWFDALVNYISTLGWPEDETRFAAYWGTADARNAVQVAGKDNLRFQTAMWQAMLMSAGLPNSKQVLIFGFITAAGQKMSKSLGNVVDPIDLVGRYGTDAVRYYLLADLPPYEDGDFTKEKFEARFMSDLANGFGNLVSRTANLIDKNGFTYDLEAAADPELEKAFAAEMEAYRFNDAIALLLDRLRKMDEFLSKEAPWKSTDEARKREVLGTVAATIMVVARHLKPVIPTAAANVIAQYSASAIKKGDPLFPRLDAKTVA